MGTLQRSVWLPPGAFTESTGDRTLAHVFPVYRQQRMRASNARELWHVHWVLHTTQIQLETRARCNYAALVLQNMVTFSKLEALLDPLFVRLPRDPNSDEVYWPIQYCACFHAPAMRLGLTVAGLALLDMRNPLGGFCT